MVHPVCTTQTRIRNDQNRSKTFKLVNIISYL